MPYSTEDCASAAASEQQSLTVWTEGMNNAVRLVRHVYDPNPVDGLESPELTVGVGISATPGTLDNGPLDAEPDGSTPDADGSVTGDPEADSALAAGATEGPTEPPTAGTDAWATPRSAGVASNPADRATVARMRLRTPIATTRRARCAAVKA